MPRLIQSRKALILGLCIVAASALVLVGIQRLQAQNPTGAPVVAVPVAPAAPAGGPSAPIAEYVSPALVQLPFNAVVPADKVKAVDIKNWDGFVTRMLRFKYKTGAGKLLTVLLPSEYQAGTKNKSNWEQLFVAWSMDVEAKVDAQYNLSPPASPELQKIMDEIRGIQTTTPSGATGGVSAAGPASPSGSLADVLGSMTRKDWE